MLNHKQNRKRYLSSDPGRQKEIAIFSRLGPPGKTFDESDGARVLIYEFVSLDKTLRTESIGEENYTKELKSFTSKSGANYDIRYNPGFKSADNIVYLENYTRLELFIDNQGYCVGFDFDLNKDGLKHYCERLKEYLPTK